MDQPDYRAALKAVDTLERELRAMVLRAPQGEFTALDVHALSLNATRATILHAGRVASAICYDCALGAHVRCDVMYLDVENPNCQCPCERLLRTIAVQRFTGPIEVL